MCIACASTHAPNAPSTTYAPFHKHKSLHTTYTEYIAQRSWGKDKGNGTTSLIRPQSRGLFLGPDSLSHPPYFSTPDSGYWLSIAYWLFEYCFLCQIPQPPVTNMIGLEVNILLLSSFSSECGSVQQWCAPAVMSGQQCLTCAVWRYNYGVTSDDLATVESGNTLLSASGGWDHDDRDRLFIPFRGSLALFDPVCLCIEQWPSSHSEYSVHIRRQIQEGKRQEANNPRHPWVMISGHMYNFYHGISTSYIKASGPVILSNQPIGWIWNLHKWVQWIQYIL